MPDILSARSTTPAGPPPLHPHLRENLVRGLRATLRRDEARREWLASAGRDTLPLQRRIEALTADLRELEAL